MKQISIILLFSLVSLQSVQAQFMGFDEVDPADLSEWITENPKNYEMIYHFGDSEMESDLILLYQSGEWMGQIQYGYFTEDGRWIFQYDNLKELRVVGNKLYSTQTNGEFVLYNDGDDNPLKCLKVEKPWSGLGEDGQYEVGRQTYGIVQYFDGNYPQSSRAILTEADLADLSKAELKIMRNEIFARYGYIFKAGGAMDQHFRKQDWYRPQHKDVNDFITNWEKRNIALIRKLEAK